jgi:hypothetical protein
MRRKNNCIACRYQRDGVKTRKALAHTCGKYVRELPSIEPHKEYYIGAECYDEVHGPGTICIMSKTGDGVITVEYMGRTSAKDFKKEVERISQHFNIKENGIPN